MVWRTLGLTLIAVAIMAFLFSRMTAVPHKFEERWQANKTTGTAAIKAVPTIRIIPLTPAPPPEPELTSRQPPPPVREIPRTEPELPPHRPQFAPVKQERRENRQERRERRDQKRGGNICERHGLRKVVTNNGRSWRCKR
jgi:type IV secretory pathway VirB10-like protein